MSDTPTKADPLHERVIHAFGRLAIQRQLDRMLYTEIGDDPLRHLTDEARAELTQRLLAHHKFARKIRTANRKLRNPNAL